MRARPIELVDANAFVALHHRHHEPVLNHRFSIAAEKDGKLVGVAICGRPVAGALDKLKFLEVARCCTDGTRNACSFLYSAAARAAQAIGYEFIQTYILDIEHGRSLRAAGWELIGRAKGREWHHTDEPDDLFTGTNRRTDQPLCDKQRWGRRLAA